MSIKSLCSIVFRSHIPLLIFVYLFFNYWERSVEVFNYNFEFVYFFFLFYQFFPHVLWNSSIQFESRILCLRKLTFYHCMFSSFIFGKLSHSEFCFAWYQGSYSSFFSIVCVWRIFLHPLSFTHVCLYI